MGNHEAATKVIDVHARGQGQRSKVKVKEKPNLAISGL